MGFSPVQRDRLVNSAIVLVGGGLILDVVLGWTWLIWGVVAGVFVLELCVLGAMNWVSPDR